jgi:hypothetical protein
MRSAGRRVRPCGDGPGSRITSISRRAAADLAWIVRGHADPVAEIKRYASRIVSAHIKDIAPAGQCADEDGWADPNDHPRRAASIAATSILVMVIIA